jgi:hypothetical protein
MNEERRQRLHAALKTLRGRRAAEIDEQVAEFIRSAETQTGRAQPRKTADRKKRNRKPQPIVTASGASTPFREWVYQSLLRFAQQALSDDPYLRVEGQKRLRAVAENISEEAAEALLRVGRLPKARARAKLARKDKGDETEQRVLNLCRELDRRREPKHKWAKTVCDRLGISRPTFYRHAPDWAKKKRSLTSDSVVRQKGGRRTSRK